MCAPRNAVVTPASLKPLRVLPAGDPGLTYPEYATQCPGLATGQALLSLSGQYIQETQVFLQAHSSNLAAKLSVQQAELRSLQEELEGLRATREALERQETDNKNTIESLHAVVFSMEPALAARLRRADDGSLLVRSDTQTRPAQLSRRVRSTESRRRRHLVRHTVNGRVKEEHVVIGPAPETHLFPDLHPPPGTPPSMPSAAALAASGGARLSSSQPDVSAEDSALGPPRLGTAGPLLSTLTTGPVPSIGETVAGTGRPGVPPRAPRLQEVQAGHIPLTGTPGGSTLRTVELDVDLASTRSAGPSRGTSAATSPGEQPDAAPTAPSAGAPSSTAPALDAEAHPLRQSLGAVSAVAASPTEAGAAEEGRAEAKAWEGSEGALDSSGSELDTSADLDVGDSSSEGKEYF